MKTLVAGWFSFEQMGASAGDLLTRNPVCQWLRQAGRPYDIAVAVPFTEGVDWRAVDPSDYACVVFVCGPFGNGEPVTGFLERFAGRRLVGVNLSMLEPLDAWNPFDLLLERDSSVRCRPDLAFLARSPHVPVVGVVLIDSQPEYGPRDLHVQANDAIHRLMESYTLAAVPIDTRLDCNKTGLRSAEEVESLIARMDVILTTRLHGTVLALKNGIPALAVDPVAGGAKILRQAQTVGWPAVLVADTLSENALRDAYDYCISDLARAKARECAGRAAELLQSTRATFLTAMSRV